MPTASSKGGEDFAPIPAGSALGICFGCVDLGTQPSQGIYGPKRQVLLLFELPHVRGDFAVDGQQKNLARIISRRWTLSLSKKANLRKDLISWRGRDFTLEEEHGFELANVVGAMALLSIIHKKSVDGSKTYANISGVMKPMAGTDKMKPENPVIVYDLPKGGPITFPAGMPEWVQNTIKNSEEYVATVNPHKQPGPTERQMANLTDGPDEDVPF